MSLRADVDTGAGWREWSDAWRDVSAGAADHEARIRVLEDRGTRS